VRLSFLADTLVSHGGFADAVASLAIGNGGMIDGTWGSASTPVAASLAGRLTTARWNDDVSTPLSNAGSSCHRPIVWTHADPAPKPLKSCQATTSDRCRIRC
jgi:hypothetical protein